MTAPLLHFARYREIAADVARRVAAGAEEAIVASSGMATAIAAAAVQSSAAGAVSLPLPTIEAFARRIVNDAGEYPRIASETEQRLAMRSAARLAADRILDSPALGAMLERSYRDLRDAALTLFDFERAIPQLRNRRHAEAMLRAWREYERLIGELGAVDPADVLLRASAILSAVCGDGRPRPSAGGVARHHNSNDNSDTDINTNINTAGEGARHHNFNGNTNANIKTQIVAGFYDMTGAQLRVVHALAAAGKLASIYVPGTGSEPFVGRFLAAVPPTAPAPQPPVLHIKIPSSEIAQMETRAAELRDICRRVRESIDNGASPASIAIVARSFTAHDLHLIRRFAAEHGFATTAAESAPLFAHRIGRSVRSILRIRDRMFPRADVLELLRDGFRVSRQIDIDALDESTRRANIAGGDSDSLRARAADYAGVVADLESFAPSSTLGGAAWAALLERLLGQFQIATAEDAAAADAISDIAAVMRRADSWRRRFDAATIIDLIEQQSLTSARDTASPEVWAGDVMRFRGRTFDQVFVARMEDEIFPQRRTEDPLLTDRDRRAIGLREIGDGRDEERLLLQLMTDGTRDVIRFSVAGSDGVGKLIRPSPLLRQLAIEKHPERRAAILRDFGKELAQPSRSAEAGPATATRQLQLIVKSGTRSAFDGYLAITPEIDARIRAALSSLSPTHLEDFGECPQKFLLKHILGVRDVDEPERELHVNPRDKGSLDHGILERFYRSLTPRELDLAVAALPQLAPALGERLEAIIDDAFDDLDTKMPPFNRAMRDIERRSTKRHLRTFVAADLADLEASGMRPRDFEYAFGPKFVRRGNAAHPEAFLYRAGDLTIPIEGSIDRIDAGGARLRIIDYKSGKALRHVDLAEKIDRGVRMQLALYALAVSEFFDTGAGDITGAIKPLRGGNDAKYSFALAEHIDQLRATIELFATSMLGGVFPAFPADTDGDFNSCKYCPVNHSCRTKHNDAEKYAVTRFRDPKTLLQS